MKETSSEGKTNDGRRKQGRKYWMSVSFQDTGEFRQDFVQSSGGEIKCVMAGHDDVQAVPFLEAIGHVEREALGVVGHHVPAASYGLCSSIPLVCNVRLDEDSAWDGH